jgi:hypothetical protein
VRTQGGDCFFKWEDRMEESGKMKIKETPGRKHNNILVISYKDLGSTN